MGEGVDRRQWKVVEYCELSGVASSITLPEILVILLYIQMRISIVLLIIHVIVACKIVHFQTLLEVQRLRQMRIFFCTKRTLILVECIASLALCVVCEDVA